MSDLAENVKSVPVWVWLLLGVVVFIAFTSHNASSGATVIQPTGDAAADSQLQQTQIAANTTLGLRVLDIAGALDLANLDASTHRHDTDTALEAIRIQNQPQPPQEIKVTVSGGSGSGSGNGSGQPTTPAPVTTLCGPGMRPSWSPLSGMRCVPITTASSARESNSALSDFTRDTAIAANNVRRTVRGVYDGAAGGIGDLFNGPSVY